MPLAPASGPTTEAFCKMLEEEALLRLKSRLDPREDSRAFGAQIERVISDAWSDISQARGWSARPPPGKRTIYDVACVANGVLLGIDIKTTDRDTGKYSDGGVCSVDNLLRFLAGDDAKRRGILIVLEVTHRRASGSSPLREVEAVAAAPLHGIPSSDIRIENLGTGQVRLERSLAAMRPEIAWSRPLDEFLASFVDTAQKHYARVASDAQDRANHLREFADRGYQDFRARRRSG